VTGSTERMRSRVRARRLLLTEAALVFPSGYLAMPVRWARSPGRATWSSPTRSTTSINGVRLTRARVVVVPHRNVAAVAAAPAGRAEERAVVVTDAVFSVDGDPLR
jgi:8-amino-7-oxononanoate synthase